MISMWTIYNLTDSISSGQSQQFQPTPVEINKFLTTKSHCNLNKDPFHGDHRDQSSHAFFDRR